MFNCKLFVFFNIDLHSLIFLRVYYCWCPKVGQTMINEDIRGDNFFYKLASKGYMTIMDIIIEKIISFQFFKENTKSHCWEIVKKTTIRNNYTKHSDAILSSIRRLSVIVLLSEESKPHFWIFHIVNILYISKIYLLTICILWFWRCSTTNGICLCANIADVLGKLELIISILFNKNRIQKKQE